MIVRKQLAGFFVLGLMIAGVLLAETASAAKGGNANTTDVTKNAQVVDSTNVLIGEVVGVNPYPARWLAVLLDPVLASGDPSLLVLTTGNRIYGSATELYFDGFNCSGNAYFKVDEQDVDPPVFTPTFVTQSASAFTVYKQSMITTPTTVSTISKLVSGPSTAQVCHSGSSTFTGVPADGTSVSVGQLSAPFKLVNP